MTEECLQLVEHLGEPLDAARSAHLGGCQHCRAVVDAHEALSRARPARTPEGAGPGLARSVSQAAGGPARPWWIEGLVAVGVNLLILAVGVWMLRGEAGGNSAPPAKLWTAGALLALLAAGGPILALAPGRRLLRTWAIAFLPLPAIAIVLGRSGLAPARSWMSAGISCLLAEIAFSLAPAIVIIWALTGSAFQVRRAAIAGWSAGAVGALALHLHCRIGTASHLLGFHVLPWLLLAAVAVAVRSRLTSKSYAP